MASLISPSKNLPSVFALLFPSKCSKAPNECSPALQKVAFCYEWRFSASVFVARFHLSVGFIRPYLVCFALVSSPLLNFFLCWFDEAWRRREHLHSLDLWRPVWLIWDNIFDSLAFSFYQLKFTAGIKNPKLDIEWYSYFLKILNWALNGRVIPSHGRT